MTEKREELDNQMSVLKTIRAELSMNRKEFAGYMDIPLRTLEEWEAGRRKMPDYVLRLISYYTRTEKFLEENNIDTTKKAGEK